jgi:phytoene dehydrogenase-like protein
MTRTVVIGGGIAGLATAALLAHEGHEVQLLEQRDRVGGRAGSLERDGFRFDTGPSWYLMPGVFDHFFKLLGTSTAEQLGSANAQPCVPRLQRTKPRRRAAGSAHRSVGQRSGDGDF